MASSRQVHRVRVPFAQDLTDWLRPGDDRHIALLGDVVRAGGAGQRLLVQRALRRIAGVRQLRGVEALVELVGVDLEREAGRGGLGGAAGGPRARDGDGLARRDPGVGALVPLAVEPEVAADPVAIGGAGDRLAAGVDQGDGEPGGRGRRGRQRVAGADVGERGDGGDGVGAAVGLGGELDALAEGVRIVDAEHGVLAVGHVAVLALHAARQVRAGEPLAVGVEQRAAGDRVARRQLVAGQAEVGALVEAGGDERVVGQGQQGRRDVGRAAADPGADVAAGARHAVGAQRGVGGLLGERRVAGEAARAVGGGQLVLGLGEQAGRGSEDVV